MFAYLMRLLEECSSVMRKEKAEPSLLRKLPNRPDRSLYMRIFWTDSMDYVSLSILSFIRYLTWLFWITPIPQVSVPYKYLKVPGSNLSCDASLPSLAWLCTYLMYCIRMKYVYTLAYFSYLTPRPSNTQWLEYALAPNCKTPLQRDIRSAHGCPQWMVSA